MEPNHCNCPFAGLQRIAACLSQGILSLDDVLQIGADTHSHLQKLIKCERCVASDRTANMLSQVIPRLISFYEAAHLNAAPAEHQARATTQHPGPSGSLSRGELTSPPAQSVPCEMRLGRLSIDGAEARMLAEVVLVDACLDLNGQMQEWKTAVDESMEVVRVGKDPVDAVIGHCCDRLAKLIGLLQFGGLYSAQS